MFTEQDQEPVKLYFTLKENGYFIFILKLHFNHHLGLLVFSLSKRYRHQR
jgi:hypothetical protein